MNDHVSLVMDDLVPTFEDELGDWSDVLTRVDAEPTTANVSHRVSKPRRRLLILAAVIAAAVATTLAVTAPWSGTPTLLDRASAALALKPGTVLHERIESLQTNPRSGKVTRRVIETWIGPNDRFRAFLRPGPGGVVDEVGSMSRYGQTLLFDSSTNTITDAGFNFRINGNPIGSLKQMLTDGKARDVGKTTINGRVVEEIRNTTLSDTSRLFIDPRTYEPVEVTATVDINGIKELTVVRFLTYQRLVGTRANLRLANIKATHPNAKVVPS